MPCVAAVACMQTKSSSHGGTLWMQCAAQHRSCARTTRGMRVIVVRARERALYALRMLVMPGRCGSVVGMRGEIRVCAIVAVCAGNRRAVFRELRAEKAQACAGQVGGARGGVAAHLPRAGPRAGAQAHRRGDYGRLPPRHVRHAAELAAQRGQSDLVRYTPRAPAAPFGARAAPHRFRRAQVGR